MTIDVYVQIEGIKGDSSDDKHTGWIEAHHLDWGVVQPKSATASSAGGHTAERAEFEELTFLKHADLSSPILMQTCSMGKTIRKVKIEFFRADGQGTRVKYFDVQLENVLIGHVAAVIQSGHLLAESVGLKYSKIKCTYTQQKIGGGAAGNTMGGWDLASNKIAV